MGQDDELEEDYLNQDAQAHNPPIPFEPVQPVVDNDMPMNEIAPEVSYDPPPEPLAPGTGLRRNPPVTIEDWPDPGSDFYHSDDEEDDTPPDSAHEQDPPFIERQEPLRMHPDDEPEFDDEQMLEMLRDILGDIADDQWIDMYARDMKDEDYVTLQFLATRLRTHFSRQTYEDLRHGACEGLGIPNGVSLFKRRRRGHSTAWPIIIINYNLHPKTRTRLENVLCVGAIPGPTQCKDLNSYLIPLLDELLQLEAGIASSALKPEYKHEEADKHEGADEVVAEQVRERVHQRQLEHECEAKAAGEGEAEGYNFVLRAFLIVVFGDIPAISKLICMKGHNALTPCRACYIQGVLCRLRRNAVYYVPLQHPDEAAPTQQLYMRTHQLFLAHLSELDAARQRTQAEYDRLSKEYGINGRFPYDIMHLLFENLVPNMIRHWTGKFKGLDPGSGTYQLPKPQWDTVGRLTKEATKYLPYSFVGMLPDIAQDFTLYKAEALSFWIQYLAPILLRGTLPNRYYQHLLLMREIIICCLQFEITLAEVDKLQAMINQWVAEYELKTGPLWASWAFVMERFCRHLLPAAKNRTRPYDHLDNYAQRRAQMQIVSKIYDFPSLARPFVQYTYENGERISTHEHVYPGFPDFVLGTPVFKNPVLDTPLLNQLAKYFAIFRPGLRGSRLRDRISRGTFISHGRIRLAGGGDNIRIADLITRDPAARDNSFIKYDLLPDANAAWRNRRDDPFRQTQYGRLLNIYYIQLREDDDSLTSYLLLRVESCNTRGLDATKPETPVVTYANREVSTPDIINAKTLVAVIGRVKMGDAGAIVDRSRGNARTQFLDDEGNVEFDDSN
ncbi:Dynein heavy chain, cytoplasmic [Rhizoctonia solani]|uniref:Dynein heavy chain, cytoplasmic n=1 Tax=Rhizoctonia solani TaxID=456999 RepID=A0A0K6FYJ1_9AGAM|nr:Dynein heavy chain, cytoplasmic [Rhizoctonia solani]